MTAAAWIILWWLVTGLIVALLFGAIARTGMGQDKDDA